MNEKHTPDEILRQRDELLEVCKKIHKLVNEVVATNSWGEEVKQKVMQLSAVVNNDCEDKT